MRFLIDNNLTPRLARVLGQFGHEAQHVRALGLANADDQAILSEACNRKAVVITADSDFPEMLALSGATQPSVLYMTGSYPTEPEQLGILIENQLEKLTDLLLEGAVVAIEPTRIRVRKLPIGS